LQLFAKPKPQFQLQLQLIAIIEIGNQLYPPSGETKINVTPNKIKHAHIFKIIYLKIILVVGLALALVIHFC